MSLQIDSSSVSLGRSTATPHHRAPSRRSGAILLPGIQRGLVLVGVGQLHVISDPHGHGGVVGVGEPGHQRRRGRLRRRSPAASGHQLVRGTDNRAAEHTQHLLSLKLSDATEDGDWEEVSDRQLLGSSVIGHMG